MLYKKTWTNKQTKKRHELSLNRPHIQHESPEHMYLKFLMLPVTLIYGENGKFFQGIK